LGKLNDTQWIVQEIFVTNGQEFPAGSNFVESTLLDAPAKTWQQTHAEDIESRVARAEADYARVLNECKAVQVKAKVQRLINRCVEAYPSIDVEQLDTLFAILSGEIAHVVTVKYDKMEILTLADALAYIDTDYGKHFEGLKLVSLFGVKEDGSRYGEKAGNPFALNWRINQYSDGSGIWSAIYPCRSHAEAVKTIDRLCGESQNVTDNQVALKAQYGLVNPSEERIAAYRKQQLANAERIAANHAESLKKALAVVDELKPKENA
jgi:hypothetical protein